MVKDNGLNMMVGVLENNDSYIADDFGAEITTLAMPIAS